MVKSLASNFKNVEPRTNKKVYVPTGGVKTYATQAAALAAKATLTDDEDILFIQETGRIYQVDDKTAVTFATLVKSSVDWSLVTNKTLVWENPLFNFYNGTAGEVYVVEKVQPYITGKVQYETVHFNVKYVVNDATDQYNPVAKTVTTVGATENPLDARRVRDLEWFAMANYGDMYDKIGFPTNLEREYISSIDGTYLVSYFIQYATKGKGINAGTESNASLQIICQSNPATEGSNSDTIEDAINTAWGY